MNVDTAGRAVFGTQATACTLGKVYKSQIGIDRDGAGGAILFTLFAADTACRTFFPGSAAFVMVTAADDDIRRNGKNRNQRVGALFCT